MSQEAFGNTLGVSRDVINNIERGRVEIKDYILRLICKTHRVNYFWLTEGKGDPYIGVPEIILDEAVEKYGLDDTDKELIEGYARLDSGTRNAIKKYLSDIFKNAPD